MPTQEERIAAIEQTMVSRIEFIDAVNRLTLQQAQNASNTSHEITILLGVVSSQGQDIRIIKEDVRATKEDVHTIKERLNRLETKFDEHTQILGEHTVRFDRLETLLTQVLARLPEKL